MNKVVLTVTGMPAIQESGHTREFCFPRVPFPEKTTEAESGNEDE